jgi:catechol 2,3-dioxygenase-like lactoylglutathione lyase family enzyme
VSIAVRGLCPLLQVFDMPASLRFYRDVLGFSEVEKSGEGDDVDWAWLRHGSAQLMLNTAYEGDHRPPSPDPSRAAGHADTCHLAATTWTRPEHLSAPVGEPAKVAPTA